MVTPSTSGSATAGIQAKEVGAGRLSSPRGLAAAHGGSAAPDHMGHMTPGDDSGLDDSDSVAGAPPQTCQHINAVLEDEAARRE